MGRTGIVGYVGLFVFGLLAIPPIASAACEVSGPTCEARGNTDPGRLNIDSEAAAYGIVKPCRTTLNLYIAENTLLRSIEGRISVAKETGAIIFEDSVEVGLNQTGYGMFANDLEIEPLPDGVCQRLNLEFFIESCRGEAGAEIACPDIRVRKPPMLAGLDVRGENTDICFD